MALSMNCLSASLKDVRVRLASRWSAIGRLPNSSCRRRLPSWYTALSVMDAAPPRDGLMRRQDAEDRLRLLCWKLPLTVIYPWDGLGFCRRVAVIGWPDVSRG